MKLHQAVRIALEVYTLGERVTMLPYTYISYLLEMCKLFSSL
jgi:hypothetical protein